MNNKKVRVKENEAQKYIRGIVSRSEEIAKDALSITVEPEHLMASVLEHMASVYIFNMKVSAAMNNIAAEMEALRRAIRNDKKDEIQA